MAASLRLLALFILMLPSPLRKYFSVSHHRPKEALHPIVLVPGASCPNIEVRLTEPYMPSVPRCGAMKGKGWFELWVNASDVLAHDYVECFKEQMSLFYDPVTNDYRNLPGVETRVPNFGSARGFHDKKPHPEYCLTVIRETLERIGYKDGETLFGAPYDVRHAPPVPSQQPSEVFSVYFKQMTLLVAGMVALEFVNSKPLAWRNKYIKHLILVAPTLPEGFTESIRNLISGTDIIYLPRTSPLDLRPTWRSFESALVDLPSQAVFGHEPLVITKLRNYSAYDIEDLLTAIGFREGIQPFKRRAVPKTQSFQAPMVPVTCINGVGNRTPRQLIYWDGDFDASPEFVFGDGDGKINLISMLAFDEKMRQHPGQRKQFKSIKLDGAQHSNIVTVEWAMRRVMQEMHEANWISSETNVFFLCNAQYYSIICNGNLW
ncbi:unnamed protein product [Urochloa decumbens]|uniref:Uncharacterized protein n=1 Tax=Urochloa decumbens TaxID=240449 RepID=A0ABC9BXW7_9POAL